MRSRQVAASMSGTGLLERRKNSGVGTTVPSTWARGVLKLRPSPSGINAALLPGYGGADRVTLQLYWNTQRRSPEHDCGRPHQPARAVDHRIDVTECADTQIIE